MNLADLIERSCLLEATARKPGNVHPAHAFVDLTYEDFARAATACAGPLARAQHDLGQAVLHAILATREIARSNVNLGIALLLAPLAAVPTAVALNEGISDVLQRTSIADADAVYEAIRAAHPGGLGDAAEQDVRNRPTVTLRQAMELAASRDTIALQYVTDFSRILDGCVPRLTEYWRESPTAQSPVFEGGEPAPPWELAILRLHCTLLADELDSLVVRKCGIAVAEELRDRARSLIRSGWPHVPGSCHLLSEFDRWLRADGHRRNPGTTADLVAATLFAAARDRYIELPVRHDIIAHAEAIRAIRPSSVSPALQDSP